MKKLLIVAMVLTTVSHASAQSRFGNPPKVIELIDKKTGEIVGRAVISNNMVILRNKHDEHYATVIQQPDGTKKWLDPNGNPIDPKTTYLPYD